MLSRVLGRVGTLKNTTGRTRIGSVDDDPDTLHHIHSVEPATGDDPADCGYRYQGTTHPGMFAPLCPRCAWIHRDQPWIQRCLARARSRQP